MKLIGEMRSREMRTIEVDFEDLTLGEARTRLKKLVPQGWELKRITASYWEEDAVPASTLILFRRELESKCKHVFLAAERMRDALRNPRGDTSHQEFWYHLESAVASMSAIVNVLWPSQSSRGTVRLSGSKLTVGERAAVLRDYLRVKEAGLPELHAVRNSLVHIDERFDDWLALNPEGNMVDLWIGNPGAVNGLDEFAVARYYDHVTGVLSVFGDNMNVSSALEEVGELYASVMDAGDPHEFVRLAYLAANPEFQ